MPVRPATRRDIPVMAHVVAASFGPDRLYQVMFPRMNEYWADYEAALRDHLWLTWYDYRKVLTHKKQRITGVAEWERAGPGWEKAVYGLWGGRWDPRLLWNFFQQVGPFAAAFFAAPHRQTHWALETLAVLPGEQGKGYGRDLVLEGLERASTDPAGDLPVSVVAADGKETFYQKVGFKELVGWNPLKANGVGGGAVLWTK
ncbi:hypothetical protein DV735_g3590, partial [Chaetothyriales sp. CBS 134920]